jgi:PadR family transcriptional regulator PadR
MPSAVDPLRKHDLVVVARYCALNGSIDCVDRSQLLKGLLDIAVLRVLETGDAYGYVILHRLREAGFTELGDASVYSTLRRLFRAGHLSTYLRPSDAGPHRKYYSLTASGAAHLRDMRGAWEDANATMQALFDTPGPSAPDQASARKAGS